MEISSVKEVDPILTDTHREFHVLVSWNKKLDESMWIGLKTDCFFKKEKGFTEHDN